MADELIYKPKLDARASKFALKLRRSRIHRFGVFALEDIARRKRVIEYTGERISRRAISRRLEGEFTYIFMLDSYWGIDGAVNGSGAEIINHSCEPNLEAHIIGGRRIYYVSLRAIRAGEELTVDYSFDTNQDPQECHCGARACRGDMRRPLKT
jgi:SET domain-containing protein